jgi:crotonobetainyl-CoA:carnitine CoA-transferase CaiB-like acyl-CoA transferase
MTTDELERIMNFIVERQEQGADQLAQAEAIITALAESQLQTDKRLAAQDERIARFERSYSSIADLLAKHDNQLVNVTDNVNKLTGVVTTLSETVDRFITAEAIETAKQRKTSPGPEAKTPGKASTAKRAATQPANGSNAALTAATKAKKKGVKQ